MLFPKIWIICRVCLQQHDDLHNIYENKFKKNIWRLLRDCGGVPVRKDDDLPDKICEPCLTKLWKASNFRDDCQRGHRELVQKLMEGSALMYTIKMENENNESCSTFATISNVDSEYQHFSSSIKLEEYLITSPIITNEYIENANDEAYTEYDSSLEKKKNFEQTKMLEKQQNKEEINGYEEILPLALLKKLKESPYMDIKKLKAKRSKISEIKKENATKKSNRNTSIIRKPPLQYERARKKIKAYMKIMLRSNLKKNITKFICKICNKYCKTNSHLRHHLYTHSKPHQCNVCQKRFSQKNGLLSHSNQHSGMKPYCCRICFKTFADISNRNSHERKLHEKEKFKCEHCGKEFRFLNFLQKHAQSHRPKECFICNKEFSSMQMVRQHHIRKHLKLNKQLNA